MKEKALAAQGVWDSTTLYLDEIALKKRKRREWISNALLAWTERARKYLPQFVKTLETWWNEVVNASLFPESNGRAEGVNNKIKLIKRQGFGFRNRLNFKRKIQAACNP